MLIPPPSFTGAIRLALDALATGLVERQRELRYCLLAALAGEHSLLLGPPGTAKSELARRLHGAFSGGAYFERLLTRFSVPEELFGPLSLAALESDRYERQTAGFLPEANIAFIDEVFHANSAILNALLMLLNERVFDNGTTRMQCPLISLVGASNTIPADDTAQAFIDRFLVRIHVKPVTAAAFPQLLAQLDAGGDRALEPFSPEAIHALQHAAQRVQLPHDIIVRLADLRAAANAEGLVVSDRRWVKTVRLLRVAAASEGRAEIDVWDLLLLPVCLAVSEAEQGWVAEWLAATMGVHQAFTPPRLTQAVDAFESQLTAERNANDLDYDESGRLRFRADTHAQAIAQEIGDAKGGSAALRMTYSRKRRFGELHISARTRQLDGLSAMLDEHRSALAVLQSSGQRAARERLWLAAEQLARPLAVLGETGALLAALAARIIEIRTGFDALPRLQAPGVAPEPVDLGALTQLTV